MNLSKIPGLEVKKISKIYQRRDQYAGPSLEYRHREEYIQKVLFNPKYGYGKHFNPCIDCHGYMFKVPKALLEKLNASFIITGELLDKDL